MGKVVQFENHVTFSTEKKHEFQVIRLSGTVSLSYFLLLCGTWRVIRSRSLLIWTRVEQTAQYIAHIGRGFILSS